MGDMIGEELGLSRARVVGFAGPDHTTDITHIPQ